METLLVPSKKELLQEITCMRLSGKGQVFRVHTKEELLQLPEIVRKHPEIIVIGSGSNFICKSEENSPKVFLRLENANLSVEHEDESSIRLKVGAGYDWDTFVEYCVKNDYAGVECLSAIPGTVGASPVQNIGAYGTELKEVFVSCEVFDRKEFIWKTLSKEDCAFGYRASIFNTTEKNRYIITEATFQLSKKYQPRKEWYPSLAEYFKNNSIETPTLQQVRGAVTEIRWSKLPKPEELGNCGSFFKNPVVAESLYEKLKVELPTLSGNKGESGIKLAAGQLLELAGLKGNKSESGHFGMYQKNALVLVHFGGGTFDELFEYAHFVQGKVFETFGVMLEIEPTIIN